MCDPTASPFSVPVIISPPSPCSAQFEWRSAAGCRVCTVHDYIEEVGDCKDGLQTVVYYRNANCNGREILTKVEKKCVAEYAISGPLVFSVGILFVFLLAGIAVAIFRNKLMEDKYVQHFFWNSTFV